MTHEALESCRKHRLKSRFYFLTFCYDNHSFLKDPVLPAKVVRKAKEAKMQTGVEGTNY